MEGYLQIIIESLERRLDEYFPKERMGVADRFLFNKAIIDVAYKYNSFNNGEPVICEGLEGVFSIMEGYGFNVNFRNEN